VSFEHLIAEGEETYLDHRENDADGGENSLGWRDTRDLLREIHGFDGGV